MSSTVNDVDTLLRKSLRSSVESLVKPHPSIRGKSVPLLGMLSFFLFEQLFSGVDTLAMTRDKFLGRYPKIRSCQTGKVLASFHIFTV